MLPVPFAYHDFSWTCSFIGSSIPRGQLSAHKSLTTLCGCALLETYSSQCVTVLFSLHSCAVCIVQPVCHLCVPCVMSDILFIFCCWFSGDPDDPRLSKDERKRFKRRIVNRESARRGRVERKEGRTKLQEEVPASYPTKSPRLSCTFRSASVTVIVRQNSCIKLVSGPESMCSLAPRTTLDTLLSSAKRHLLTS